MVESMMVLQNPPALAVGSCQDFKIIPPYPDKVYFPAFQLVPLRYLENTTSSLERELLFWFAKIQNYDNFLST